MSTQHGERLTLRPITLREANAFVEAHHRHNGPTQGHRFSVAATAGADVVGVAIIGRPVARLLDDGLTAEVTRVCVRPEAPRNTNSFLYGACWRCWRAMGGRCIITYTLATESGASLRGAGWRVVAQCSPTTWDRPNRERREQPVYGQQKVRWEGNPAQREAPGGGREG